MNKNKITLDKPANEILAAMEKGLNVDHKITREEIYGKDRYKK